MYLYSNKGPAQGSWTCPNNRLRPTSNFQWWKRWGWQLLWNKPLWIAWEKGCLADVIESAEEHHHSLQANAEATVWRCAIPRKDSPVQHKTMDEQVKKWLVHISIFVVISNPLSQKGRSTIYFSHHLLHSKAKSSKIYALHRFIDLNVFTQFFRLWQLTHEWEA